LLLGLATRHLPAANNKTAAFAGRCFGWLIGEGVVRVKAQEKPVIAKNIAKTIV
jgi:hypothetical protein